MKKFLVGIFLVSQLFAALTPFDAHRAFEYLEKQVAIGPRIPGTETHRICRDWIIDLCREQADTVIIQSFPAYQPFTGEWLEASNIIARFQPENPRRVMISTHFDTRPVADMDPYHPKEPVPGANDGASGTAVLLELLPYIRDYAGKTGVDLVFWDAEDMGLESSNAYFCQGSEYYAHNPVLPLPQKGILIDMIGDADLEIPIEINSSRYAAELVNEVWNLAAQLGYGHIFLRKMGLEIFDDHVPLNRIAKIPTIDLIDFHYRSAGKNLWHTTRDIPAYCSPRSLQIIGELLLLWLEKQ